DMKRVIARDSLTQVAIVARALGGETALGVERFHDGHEEMLGAFSRLSTLGWGLVLYHPVKAALAPVQALTGQHLFWLGASIAFALIAGTFSARGISKPVNLLADGARRIARGELDHRIAPLARDEIGLLAEAFNAMGTELDKKNRELEQWNQ